MTEKQVHVNEMRIDLNISMGSEHGPCPFMKHPKLNSPGIHNM
jgi:hypothetical protein